MAGAKQADSSPTTFPENFPFSLLLDPLPCRSRTRRDFLQFLSLILFPLRLAGETRDFPEELAPYDLYLPPQQYWERTRKEMYDPRKLEGIVRLFFREYLARGTLALAEAAFFYAYALWRAIPERGEREKFTTTLMAMGEEVAKRHPRSPLGFTMQTAATGMHIVSTGVLNALHLMPVYRKMLEEALSRNRTYFYGLLLILQGALYLKAPPFPVAIGDLSRARGFLEEAGTLARKVYGFWYIFWGELLLLTEGVKALERVQAELVEEVRPPNAYLAYIRDSAIMDLEALLRKAREGSYDKYLYSPLLEVARSSGMREKGS